jgi:transglutaminase-like putative cysteine protease
MERRQPINRWWDLPAAFLFIAILTVAFTRLVVTEWTQDLEISRFLAFLGLAAGLALGYSRFSPLIATLFGVAYGVYAVPWQLGQLYGPGVEWPERLTSMANRLAVIISQISKQEVVTDNLLFLFLMSILFWVLGVHGGYSLTRYASPWRTVLPAGLTMVVIHNYDPYVARRIWLLFAYLFFALVLVARLVYLHNRTRWQVNQVYTPPQLGVDFIRVTLLASAILILFAWTAPALADALPVAASAWQTVKRPWDNFRDRFDNAFGSLRSSVGIVNDYYGDSLSLGRGNRLSDSVVFSVAPPEESPDGVRYYWRARIFDSFQDNGWRSTLKDTVDVNPQAFDLNLPQEAQRDPTIHTFQFTLANAISTIFVAPQPVWFSRPAEVELANNPDGSADISSIRANPPLRSGDTYQVDSSLSGVTIKQMREAGTEYPEWVAARYLALPETVTDRTRELAAQITAGLETPYDKTVAITDWLRNNIEYEETIQDLPNRQDLVDWFLFDYRKGFCNYYATAEIVLLRTLGIPSRMAIGYAQGEFDGENNLYTIRQRDAHAWPEVYFPGLGWVEFEPTAGQPSIVRPSGDDSAASGITPNIPRDFPEELEERLLPERDEQAGLTPAQNRTRSIIALSIAGAALALLALPFARRRSWFEKLPRLPIYLEKGLRRLGLQPPAALRRWAQHAALPPLSRAYMEINHALRRIGRRPHPTETPAERGRVLARAIPDAGGPTQRLVNEYQTSTYGPRTAGDLEIALSASHEIRTLSLRAMLKRVIKGTRPPEKEANREDRLRR